MVQLFTNFEHVNHVKFDRKSKIKKNIGDKVRFSGQLFFKAKSAIIFYWQLRQQQKVCGQTYVEQQFINISIEFLLIEDITLIKTQPTLYRINFELTINWLKANYN